MTDPQSNLIAVAKEALAALAAACRVIARHDAIEEFFTESKHAGVEPGVGVRLQQAIAEAEVNHATS